MHPHTLHRRLPLYLLLAVLAAYLALVWMHGRLFNIDEVFYKAAGAHWGVEGIFAAPELTGRLPFDPPIAKVFACYPPLYPFAFGVFVKVLGFGYSQLSMFDALTRTLLCVTTYLVARRLNTDTPSRWPAVLAGITVLPLGAIGRPDDLSTIFSLLACLRLLAGNTRGRSWQAGAFLGLAAATSLVCAGVYAAICTGLVMTEQAAPLRAKLGKILTMGWVSACVLMAAFTPLLLVDSHAWRQLLDHAADNVRSDGLWVSWSKGWLEGQYTIVASVGVAASVAFLALWAWRAGSFHSWLRVFPAALLMLVVLVLKTDGKYYYLWFAGPWLVAAALGPIWHAWSEGGQRLAVLPATLLLIMGVLYGAQFWVVERLVLARLPATQRFDAASARVREIVPAGAPIIACEHWITFFGRNPIHELSVGLTLEERETMAYVVVTGNGSREPGRPQRHPPNARAYFAENFELVYDDLSREPLCLFGVRITNSAYGWGAAVFRRRDTEAPSSARLTGVRNANTPTPETGSASAENALR